MHTIAGLFLYSVFLICNLLSALVLRVPCLGVIEALDLLLFLLSSEEDGLLESLPLPFSDPAEKAKSSPVLVF